MCRAHWWLLHAPGIHARWQTVPLTVLVFAVPAVPISRPCLATVKIRFEGTNGNALCVLTEGCKASTWEGFEEVISLTNGFDSALCKELVLERIVYPLKGNAMCLTANALLNYCIVQEYISQYMKHKTRHDNTPLPNSKIVYIKIMWYPKKWPIKRLQTHAIHEHSKIILQSD